MDYLGFKFINYLLNDDYVPVEIKCGYCGKVFYVKPSHVKKRRFCSFSCRNKAVKQAKGKPKTFEHRLNLMKGIRATPSIKNETPEWVWVYLAGLIDGDGSFGVDIFPSKRQKVGIVVRPYIYITQAGFRAKYLEELINLFYCGKATVKKYHYENSNWRDIYTIRFSQFVDVKMIAEKVSTFSILKRNEWQIFLKILSMIEEGKHLTKEGVEEISKLRDELVKHYKCRKRYKNSERIREILGMKE